MIRIQTLTFRKVSAQKFLSRALCLSLTPNRAPQNIKPFLGILYNPRYLSSKDPVPTSRKKKVAIPFDFGTEALSMMKTIETAVAPLKLLNKNFEVYFTQDNSELIISTPRGNHRFFVDGNHELLILHSYFSGYHKYFFDKEERLWLCEKDGHDLRGLLTRDLMRHFNGVPTFE